MKRTAGAAFLAAILAPIAPALGAGQEPVPPSPFCASFHLPQDRWAVDAAARLDRAGLLPRDHPWGFRSPEAGDVERAFRLGAERLADGRQARMPDPEEGPALGEGEARSIGPAWGAALLRDRLGRELRGLEEPCREEETRRFLRVEWAEAWAGAGGARNELRMGVGSTDYSGPVAVPDRAGAAVGASGALTLVPGVGLMARGEALDGHARADDLHLTGRVGPLGLWAGRRTPGYGSGVGGSVILSGGVPLDGVGLGLERAVQLPWVLEVMGPVRFETALARMSDSGAVGRPWFWTARATAAPADWLRLGLNRGAFMGGEGSPSLTPSRVGWILLGSRPKSVGAGEPGGRSAVANQVASFEVELRGRLGAVPVAGYVEWGMEDSSGAWKRQPGWVAGLELPLLGASASSLGVEMATFSRPNGHGHWYRHWQFTGGWADRGRLLAHPLGGAGRELRLHGTTGLLDQAVRGRLDVYRRSRHETNALGPQMEGTGHGVRALVEGRLDAAGLAVFGELEGERASAGWRRADGRVGLRWFF